MLRILHKRVETAASLSHEKMSGALARRERLFNLTNATRRRMNPEQIQLLLSWQEECDLLEQSLEHVDSVLHGYDTELSEDVGQSFMSEPSSSTFRFQW